MSAGLKPFIDFLMRRLLVERLVVTAMLAALYLPAILDPSALWVSAPPWAVFAVAAFHAPRRPSEPHTTAVYWYLRIDVRGLV
jgi:hypothetical protein